MRESNASKAITIKTHVPYVAAGGVKAPSAANTYISQLIHSDSEVFTFLV